MKKKTVLALALVLVMVFGLAAACTRDGGASPSPGTSPGASPGASSSAGSGGDSGMLGNMYLQGLPIVKDKVTLRFTALRSSAHQNAWSEMQLFIDYEELTNVHIDWLEIEEAVWAERTQLMLSSNDLPDAFYSWPIADNIILTYGEQGSLIPLNDLIDTYAPNILKGMSYHPNTRVAMTYPNGNIYAVPMQNIGPQVALQNFLWMNMEWLAEVGMEEPKTTEEFYEVLKAFKTRYPNDIPFTFMQFTPNGLVHMQFSIMNLFGSFGVLDNDRHIMRTASDELLFTPAQAGYLEGLRYFHRLASEGLLDPESFTQTQEQMQAKARSENGVGATLSNTVNFIYDFKWPEGHQETMEDYYNAKYQTVAPFDGPNGRAIFGPWSGVQGSNTGRFMITNVCKTPEVAMRWVDLFCDNLDNANNIRQGPKDTHWEYDDEGYFNQINPPRNVEEGVTYHPLWYCVWWWYDSPERLQKYPPSVDVQFENQDKYGAHVVTKPLPPIKFYLEESETLSEIQVDLFKYVDSSLANFILNGVTDAQWQEYLTNLERYGMNTYMEIFQTGFNRVK